MGDRGRGTGGRSAKRMEGYLQGVVSVLLRNIEWDVKENVESLSDGMLRVSLSLKYKSLPMSWGLMLQTHLDRHNLVCTT